MTELDQALAPIKATFDGYRSWYDALDPAIRDAASRLLAGAVDAHVHCDPSLTRRSADVFEAAEAASRAHMRAMVIKDHHAHTEELAWLAQRHADIAAPFEVFGSTWLNNYAGGWNVFAVDRAILFGARIIGAPTVSARGQLAQTESMFGPGGQHPADLAVTSVRPPRQPIAVPTLDDRGHVLPEVLECVDLIADAGNVVLGGGHLDQGELFTLVRTAAERGVRRICLTHATLFTSADMEELRELCLETGAVCELSSIEILGWGASLADDIRTLGLENVILSTDAGFFLMPAQVTAYTQMLARLLEAGLTEAEISIGARQVPARLLDLA